MGLFDFIKSAGHALGLASEETPPTAEDLKKEPRESLSKSDLDLLQSHERLEREVGRDDGAAGGCW